MRLKAIVTVFLILALSLFPQWSSEGNSLFSINDISSTYEFQEKEPLVSGPVEEVPWSEDNRFMDAMKANSLDVMLAAYRTVLHDPLPGEENNVHYAARLLSGIVIKPGGIFSQNNSIGPYTAERGYQWGPTYSNGTLTKTIGGGVCKIASTLYNTSVLSNLEIVERYNHSMPVPYVPYGQDATVSFGAKDFKFWNDSDEPLMIWAQGIDNVLYMAFYGRNEAPDIKWRHVVLGTSKASKSYKYNASLSASSENVLLEGMDGMRVKSWITITDGDQITEKYMGISEYKPMPWLIEKGGN